MPEKDTISLGGQAMDKDATKGDDHPDDRPEVLAAIAAKEAVEQQKVLNRLTLLIVPALYLTALATVAIALFAALTWWQNAYGTTPPPTPVEIILPECQCPETQPTPPPTN